TDGRVDVDHFASLVGPRTRLVAFGHVSNALGTINPVAELAAIARRVGALVVVDGAQAAPHLPLEVDAMDVDFYAFSGHKMLGPMGCGVLVGKRDILESMRPYQTGGDMIEFVGDSRTTWNVLPHKFEAGTPNVADAVGLASACDYLEKLGMSAVREHERRLTALASERLAAIGDVHLYGPPPAERSGVVSFTVGDIHPHDLATILDEAGVCIRAGHHCAQPLMRRLNLPATARASFYVYNTEADVDALVAGIQRAREVFG
ncbi:MAG TPA: cysteine desulfurase, partial [Gemmatimonadaceae bacterium]|nr:cysteine desulfurase [Gemmatimonadaceae bacterium]